MAGSVNLGPAQVELSNLYADRSAALVLDCVDAAGADYTPSSVSLYLYTHDSTTPVDTITGTVTTGQVSFDLADAAALEPGSGVYRYEIVADGVSWLVGPVDLRAVNSGRGRTSARSVGTITVGNGSATVNVTVLASGLTSATNVTVTPTGDVSASNVQAAIAELASEKATTGSVTSAIAALSTVYQPLDSDLTAIAALSTTSYGRAFLALADAAAGRTALGVVIGTDVQAYDSDLAAIAALSTTSFGRGLLALADAAALRASAGLGTIATQAASSVAITGGTIAGITDLAVADGGTGSSTAAGARANLGLAIGSNVQAWAADLDAIAALSPAADQVPYYTGATSAALTSFTATGRSIVGAASVAAANAVLGVTRQLVTFSAATPTLISGNLLSLDQQRGISSIVADNGSISLAQSGGADGGGSVLVTSTGSFAGALTNGVAVVAGTAYTASARVLLNSATARNCRIDIEWRNGGTTLSTSVGTAVMGAQGRTTTISTTATAPASANLALLHVYSMSDAGTLSGENASVSVICLRTSATIPESSGVSGISATFGACIRASGGFCVATCSGTTGGISRQLTVPSGANRADIALSGTRSSGSGNIVLVAYNGTTFVYDIRTGITTDPTSLRADVLDAAAGSSLAVYSSGLSNGATFTLSNIYLEWGTFA